MNGLNLGDDEDDSEEEARKAAEKDLAARQLRAKLEREEKQRKYTEARARLFGPGASTVDSNGGRSPSPVGTSNARAQQPRRGARRAGGTPGSGGRDSHSHSASSADQSPARAPMPIRQLYDPDMRPGSVLIQKRGGATSGGSSRADSPNQNQPIRLPKGPDGSGRGGFGFAQRGNRTGNTS